MTDRRQEIQDREVWPLSPPIPINKKRSEKTLGQKLPKENKDKEYLERKIRSHHKNRMLTKSPNLSRLGSERIGKGPKYEGKIL